MEMPWKTWNKKDGREKGRVILALKGMESIWAEIKVVILTRQNPFGGSGIQMETTQVWFKMEYDRPPHKKIDSHKQDFRFVKKHPSPLFFLGPDTKTLCRFMIKHLHSHKSWNILSSRRRFIHLSHCENVCMCTTLRPFPNYFFYDLCQHPPV